MGIRFYNNCYCFIRTIKSAINGRLINDLEAPAFKIEPILSEIKNEILSLGDSVSGVMMSGCVTIVIIYYFIFVRIYISFVISSGLLLLL